MDIFTYKIEDAAGVARAIAVVQGAADGGCKKPGGANAAGFLGFSTEPQLTQNKGVAIQKSGRARAVASGAITRGDRLTIADNTGKVLSSEAAIAGGAGAYTLYNVVAQAEMNAADGDEFWVWIRNESILRAAS